MHYHSYGDSDVLVHEEADRPVAGPAQVLVQVAAWPPSTTKPPPGRPSGKTVLTP